MLLPKQPLSLTKAFTIVEVLIILVLIGTISALTVFKLNDAKDRSDLNFLKTAINVLDKGIDTVVLKEGSFPTINGGTPAEKLAEIVAILKTKNLYVKGSHEDKLLSYLAQQVSTGLSLDEILTVNLKSIGSKPSGDPTNVEIFVLPATPTIVFPEKIVLFLNTPADPNYSYSNTPSGDLASAIAYFRENGQFLNPADRALVLGNIANSGLTTEDIIALFAQVDSTEMASLLNQMLQLLSTNELGGLASNRAGLLALLETGINQGLIGAEALPSLLFDLAPWGELSVDAIGPILTFARDQLTSTQLSALVAGLSTSPGFFNTDDPPSFSNSSASDIYYSLLNLTSPLSFDQRKALILGTPADLLQRNNLISTFSSALNYDILLNPNSDGFSGYTYTAEQFNDFINTFEYFDPTFINNLVSQRDITPVLSTNSIDSLLDLAANNPNNLNASNLLARMELITKFGSENVTEDQLTSFYNSTFWDYYGTQMGANNAENAKFAALGSLTNVTLPTPVYDDLLSKFNAMTITNAGLVGQGARLTGLASALAASANLNATDAQAVFDKLVTAIPGLPSSTTLSTALGEFLGLDTVSYESKKTAILGFPSTLEFAKLTAGELTDLLTTYDVNGPTANLRNFISNNEFLTPAHSDAFWAKITSSITPANFEALFNQGVLQSDTNFTESTANSLLNYATANNLPDDTGVIYGAIMRNENLSQNYRESTLNTVLATTNVELLSNYLSAMGSSGTEVINSLYGNLSSTDKQQKIDDIWSAIQTTYQTAVTNETGSLNGFVSSLILSSDPTKATAILDTIQGYVNSSETESYLGSTLVASLLSNPDSNLSQQVLDKIFDLTYADTQNSDNDAGYNGSQLVKFALANSLNNVKLNQSLDLMLNSSFPSWDNSVMTVLSTAPLTSQQLDTLINNPGVIDAGTVDYLYRNPNLSPQVITDALNQFDQDPYTDNAYYLQMNPNPVVVDAFKNKLSIALTALQSDPDTIVDMYTIGALYNNDPAGLTNVYTQLITHVPNSSNGVQGLLDQLAIDVTEQGSSPAVEAAIAAKINDIYTVWKNADFLGAGEPSLNEQYYDIFKKYLTYEQKLEMRTLFE